MSGDTKTIADLVGRCLAAEQRAEAAEAERDRMRVVVDAAIARAATWRAYEDDDCTDAEVELYRAWSAASEALTTAIDAILAADAAARGGA